MNAPTIQQIKDAQPVSLWSYLEQLPASMEAQVLYGLLLAGALGMFAHYGMNWLRGNITGSLIKYLFFDYPKRTALAFAGVVGAALTAIMANVFLDDSGHFVGWLNVLWLGLTNGYAADSLANKGGIKDTPEPDITEITGIRKPGGFALVELLIALGITATIAAVVWGAIAYIDDVEKSADAAGYSRAVGETLKRDKADLLRAQGQIKDLMLEKAAADEAHATEQARLAGLHAKEVADEKAKTADTQHRIRTGELVLVDPGRTGGSGTGGCNAPGDRGSSTTLAATAPAAGSGQAQPEGVSPAFAGFLAGEASLADEVANDLALCWGIARDDRARLARRL